MNNEFNILPVTTDTQIKDIAALAALIWNEHFTPIIGQNQVDYMLDKFQSYPALKTQIVDGYHYFQLFFKQTFIGYTGIQIREHTLFLSKLYLLKDARGNKLSTKVIDFMQSFCQNHNLEKIQLTCNKYNAHTLAVYKHLGFEIANTQVADIGSGYVMDDYILEKYI